MLRSPSDAWLEDYRGCWRSRPLVAVDRGCLATKQPDRHAGRCALHEHAHGTPHLGVTVSPLSTTTATQGAICLFTDLTRRRARRAAAAEGKPRAVGELTAGIAHEFRNGLATIHGYSRLIDLDALPAHVSAVCRGHS